MVCERQPFSSQVLIVLVCRGLLRDENMYPDASNFSPERYLTRRSDSSWELREDVIDPRTFAFGFGRRVCPGKNIAEQGLFATLTTVIHTLDVRRAKDANGREVIPDVQMSSGLLCHPVPFAYELRMRDDAKHLVETCAAAVEK
jgi:cytochrome P450